MGFVVVSSFANVPSGKRLHNYGKSPLFIGKSTISTGPFSIAMLNYQRVKWEVQHKMGAQSITVPLISQVVSLSPASPCTHQHIQK